jgi:hypothetical protein
VKDFSDSPKIYGIDEQLRPVRQLLSDTIQSCVCEALVYPEDKRNHLFFPMSKGDLFPRAGRSDSYTIIEIVMIAGRSIETRKLGQIVHHCTSTHMRAWYCSCIAPGVGRFSVAPPMVLGGVVVARSRK